MGLGLFGVLHPSTGIMSFVHIGWIPYLSQSTADGTNGSVRIEREHTLPAKISALSP